MYFSERGAAKIPYYQITPNHCPRKTPNCLSTSNEIKLLCHVFKRNIKHAFKGENNYPYTPLPPLFFSLLIQLDSKQKKTGNFIDTIISCLLLGNVPISSVCLKASLSSYSSFTCCYIWCFPLFLCLFEFIVLVLIIIGRPKNKKPFLARHIDFNVNEGKKKIDLIFKKKINLLHI